MSNDIVYDSSYREELAKFIRIHKPYRLKPKLILNTPSPASIRSNKAIFAELRELGMNFTDQEFAHYFINGSAKVLNSRFCPICGKPNSFKRLNSGYTKTCSIYCAGVYSSQSKQETCMANYGVPHPMQSPIVQANYRRTSQLHYGVPNPMSNLVVYAQRCATMIELYDSPHTASSPIIRQKQLNTVKQRYGVDNVMKVKAISQHSGRVRTGYKRQASRLFKRFLLRKNSPQPTYQDVHDLLLTYFPTVQTDHPSYAHFYIPSEDIYINYFGDDWTHGTEPFNPHSKVHKAIQNRLSLHERQYRALLFNWSYLDPTKVQYAERHNMTWLNFYSYSDLLYYLQSNYQVLPM